MELAPGAKLGPYEVLSPLGAGGMGQVWKARDTRLAREVAIKIISHEKSGDPGLQLRFEREARALSALNHPNIVCVYDVGEQDGAQYIVSELVQGESLRQAIAHGPLPSDRLLRLATEISGALASAHAAGIVHRDLKPENIMITPEGRPKILDFGLARRVNQPAAHPDSTVTQSAVTQLGTVMGTAGYMSPEQICGEDADCRSDLFSMGVVLYEMATGTRAFQGRSSIEMMSAILKDDPPHLPAKLHHGLDRIIRRCLEKSPAKRFQSATELNSALASLQAGVPGRRGMRLVWVGLAALALIEGGTIAVGFYSHGRKATPLPTASQVTGTPQSAAAPLSPVVTPPAPPPTPAPVKEQASKVQQARPPRSDAAYQQAYESGMLSLSEHKWPQAVEQLTEATRLKPDSGLAWLGLCHIRVVQEDYEKAISDCGQVIQRIPNSAEAYHERGTANLLSQKFDQAVEDLNAAIRFGDTNPAMAHNLRGRAHSGLQEWGAAIQDFDEAIRLNPQMPHFYVYRGMALNARNQHLKAIDDFTQAIRLQPNLRMAYTQRAIARQRSGDLAGAAADRNQAKELRK